MTCYLRLLLLLAVFAGPTRADQTIIVDGQDLSVKYTQANTTDTGSTWTEVQRSSDTCDTNQELTQHIGDYVTFTFTGTGIFVIGTIGVKRGIIDFDFDGTNSTFDRTSSQLQCDAVLFQRTGLPFEQHTIVATFSERETNESSGEQDGVLSIQRFRYTIPGSAGLTKGAKIGLIVGIIAAVLVLGGIAFALIARKRKRMRIQSRMAAGFFDGEDLPPNDGSRGAFIAAGGLVATPFEWNKATSIPSNNYQPNAGNHRTSDDDGSRSPSMPLLYSGLPSPPSANLHWPNADRSSSSASGDRYRDSAGMTTLVASNSDMGGDHGGRLSEKAQMMMNATAPGNSRPGGGGSSAGGGGGGNGTGGDIQLVDRIAHRLADIMSERGGGATGTDLPPPPFLEEWAARGGPSQSGHDPMASLQRGVGELGERPGTGMSDRVHSSSSLGGYNDRSGSRSSGGPPASNAGSHFPSPPGLTLANQPHPPSSFPPSSPPAGNERTTSPTIARFGPRPRPGRTSGSTRVVSNASASSTSAPSPYTSGVSERPQPSRRMSDMSDTTR